MAWVVDTCAVLDVLENDPLYGLGTARRLRLMRSDGLVVCPVSVVELGPAFLGDLRQQKEFFDLVGFDGTQSFTMADTEAAHTGWDRYVRAKRKGLAARRPVADILIGGFAMRFQGLVTRNPSDFAPWFPNLKIIAPSNRRGGF